MNRVPFLALNLLLAAAAPLGLLQCNDDEPAAPAADGGTSSGSIPPDASFEDIADPTAKSGVPTPRNWKPTVVALALSPQPMPLPDGGAVDPGFTVPLIIAQNEAFAPARKPDIYVDSKSVGGISLGCIGYKFAPANPKDPKGPGLTHGDMGDVTLTGFSGTGKYLAPPHAGEQLANPIVCSRYEKVPADPGAGFPGLFDYRCNVFGPLAPPSGGGASFLAKTDMLTVTTAGGADLPTWNTKVPASPNDNLVVKSNLWGYTAADFDGTKDLTIEYECGGAACGMAANINVVIASSNARTGGRPANPFGFPGDAPGDPNPTEAGFINCLDFLPASGNSYTIPKEVIAQIPPSWNDLRVVVATVNGNFTSVEKQPAVLAAGFARYGISRR